MARLRVWSCICGNSRTGTVAISSAGIPSSRPAIFMPTDLDTLATPSFVSSGRQLRSGRARPLRSRSIGRRSPSVALTTTFSSRLEGLIGANNLLHELVTHDISLRKVDEANALDPTQHVLHLDQS